MNKNKFSLCLFAILLLTGCTSIFGDHSSSSSLSSISSTTSFQSEIEEIYNNIALPSVIETTITQLELKKTSLYGSTILWATSDATIINQYGNVYHAIDDKNVVLTAEISYDNDVYYKDYEVKVKKSGKVDFQGIIYRLYGSFDDSTLVVSGKMEISFTSLVQEDLDELYFNMYPYLYEQYSGAAKGGIEIEWVKDDEDFVSYVHNRYYLQVMLEHPLSFSAAKFITISFKIQVPVGTERLGCFNGTCSITQWYPILAKYNEETKEWNIGDYPKDGESDYVVNSSFELEFNYPSKYTAASSGIDSGVIEEGNRKTLFSYLENGRHMVIIFGERLTEYIPDSDVGRVRFFYDFSQTTTSLINKFAQKFLNAIQFFIEKCGVFAYEAEFDVVETGVEGFAMEYSGLIQMGTNFNYSSYYSEDDYMVLVHELAHQWFYSKVGSDSGADPFIDEGFTSFITAYYFTNVAVNDSNGLQANADTYEYYRSRYALPIGTSMSTFDNYHSMYLSISVYYGTTTLLYEMLNVLGEEVMDDLLMVINTEYYLELLTRNELFLLIQETINTSARRAFEECLNTVYKYGFFGIAYNQFQNEELG